MNAFKVLENHVLFGQVANTFSYIKQNDINLFKTDKIRKEAAVTISYSLNHLQEYLINSVHTDLIKCLTASLNCSST